MPRRSRPWAMPRRSMLCRAKLSALRPIHGLADSSRGSLTSIPQQPNDPAAGVPHVGFGERSMYPAVSVPACHDAQTERPRPSADCHRADAGPVFVDDVPADGGAKQDVVLLVHADHDHRVSAIRAADGWLWADCIYCGGRVLAWSLRSTTMPPTALDSFRCLSPFSSAHCGVPGGSLRKSVVTRRVSG